MKILSVLVAALLLGTLNQHAGTHTWSGAVNGLWDNPANWSSGGRPSNGEPNLHIGFPATATRYHSTNNIAGVVIQTITFNGSGYNVHGVGAGTNISVSASGKFSSAGVANVLGGTLNIELLADYVIEVEDSSALTIASRFYGTAGIYKMGPGTATFSSASANTYSGTTVVHDGTLRLQGGFAFLNTWIPAVAIPSTLVVGATNMTFSPRVLWLQSSQLASNILVAVNANGTLDLNGYDDQVGTLTMTGGTVETGTGMLTLLDDVQANASPHINGSIAGQLSLGTSTKTIHVAGGSFGISANIRSVNGGRGAPGITKTGPGTLTLVGSNSYSGLTTVNAGVLEVASTRALGATNSGTIIASNGQMNVSVSVGDEALTLSGGGTNGAYGAMVPIGTLIWTGPITLAAPADILVGHSNQILVLSGPISGPGSLHHDGKGTIELGGSQPNTFTGVTRVTQGRLRLAKLNGATAVAGALDVGFLFEPARVEWLGNNQVSDSSPIFMEGNSQLDLNDHSDAVGALSISKAYIETGNGTLQLNGDVHVAGEGVSLIDGTLSLGGSTRAFDVEPGASLYIEAQIVNGGAPAGLVVSGGGNFALRSANTFSGPVLVTDGWLYVDHPLALGSTSAGTTVQGGGRIDLAGVDVTNETLTMAGGSGTAWLVSVGTNYWSGPLVIQQPTRIYCRTNDYLMIPNQISGPENITLRDGGTVEFAGVTDNLLSGTVTVAKGRLILSKANSGTAIGGPLVVGDPSVDGFAFVELESANQIANHVVVTTYSFGRLDIGTFTETIGGLVMHGGTVQGSGLLTLLGDVTVKSASAFITSRTSLGGATRTFHVETSLDGPYGVTDGGVGAGLIKTGVGRMALINSNSYSGPTTIAAGTLEIWSRFALGSPGGAGTTVSNGATLAFHFVSNVLEELTISGFGVGQTSGVLRAGSSNCHVAAAIHLAGDSLIQFETPQATLDLAGGIDGAGDLIKDGPGTLTFSGGAANTYSGATYVNAGTLRLNRFIAASIPGSLTVGQDVVPALSTRVLVTAPSQFGDLNSFVRVRASGYLIASNATVTLPPLQLRDGRVVSVGSGEIRLAGDVSVESAGLFFPTLDGKVSLGSGTRTFNVNSNAALQVPASLSDGTSSAALLKLGAGSMSLFDSNSYSGLTTIGQGTVAIFDSRSLGTAAAGTIVSTQGVLSLQGGVTISGETLELRGEGWNGFGALQTIGTNRWESTVTLASDTEIFLQGTNSRLALAGAVVGPGGLRKSGPGTLQLSGTASNTFLGTFHVAGGTVELAKTNAQAVAGALSANNAVVRSLGANQIHDLAAVTVGNSARWEMTPLAANEVIGALSGYGEVQLNFANLAVGSNGVFTAFDGEITGTLASTLRKVGPGTWTLAGASAFPGNTLVELGTLLVHGSHTNGPVMVQLGATLGGTGAVANVTVAGGIVSPGGSPGTLRTRQMNFGSNSLLFVESKGASGHDQLAVTGSVNITNTALAVTATMSSSNGAQHVILSNDGSDPVNGTFLNLPEGATLAAGPVQFSISYLGGDGNDVVLTQISTPQPSSLSSISVHGSVILAGTGTSGAVYQVEANGNLSNTNGWVVIGSATANGSGQLLFTDTNAPFISQRFYRFKAQ